MKLLSTTVCLILSLTSLHAARTGVIKNPDFTKGDEIPKEAVHDWNLGATGARGWMHSDKLTTSAARQIKITKIVKGSPASESLKVGDVILGIGRSPFKSDPRTLFGKALTAAEAGNGKLDLIVWRAGKTNRVTVQLPSLGSYSSTAPYNCPKSEKILSTGCDVIAKRIDSGFRHRHPITRSLNALALLASGDEKYLPQIKQEAEWASNFSEDGFKSWSYSYVTIFLAEYTLATGDKTFLPGLRRLALDVSNGQSAAGSWGHRFVSEDGRLRGYGMMNSPGIPLTIGLVLAQKAGVDDAIVAEAIDKSTKLVRFYTNKGAIPYGDHTPWTQTHDDNGKNGMAAMLFSILGEKEPTTFFSKMGLASHGAERDCGHTGNFFNITWSLPGVAQSGPNATGAWMQQFGAWYSDLARQSDGSFIHQGPPNTKPDKYVGWDCTGAYLISYAMPLKKIYLTGKQGSAADALSSSQAKSIVIDGKGWSNKNRDQYDSLSQDQLIKRLSSWSPTVRERSVLALAKRKQKRQEITDRVLPMLKSNDLHSQIGACQMLAQFTSADAVPALTKCLDSNDLWLRIKAAEALAATGEPAMGTLPKLLEMVAQGPSKEDPRAMQQRYLSSPIFDKMLKKSLKDVDQALLQKAIIEGLKNEDGRARGSVSKIYNRLSYEDIKPLLPAIYQAIKTPAPSGIMFAGEVRLSGVELLAKHRIKEGVELTLVAMDIDKWGKGSRIKRCLSAIEKYGPEAAPILPQLVQLEEKFSSPREAKSFSKYLPQLRKIIKNIESNKSSTPLRSLN